MFHRKHPLLSFGFLFGLALQVCGASTIYDNTAGALASRIDIGCLDSTCHDMANSFLTPAGSLLSLIRVGASLAPGTATGSITGYLYSSTVGSSPVPDAPLATLTTFTHADLVASSTGFFYFTPSSGILLNPSTRYWVVLIGSDAVPSNANFEARWRTTNNNSGIGVSTEFHANWTGSAWQSQRDTTFLGTPQMSVEAGSAAPEPGTLWTAGAMAAALCGLSLRRSRQKAELR
jgi:hypothetical protein